MFSKECSYFTCLPFFALFFTSSLDALASPNDATPAGYVLSIDQGAPGALEIGRQDYVAAIKAAQRSDRHGNDLSAQHSLCVAAIALANFTLAETACDRAVALAHVVLTTELKPHGHTNRVGLAKAYSNRSILRVMQGDREAAAEDIAQALAQRREQETVRHNLKLSTNTAQVANR